METFKTQSFVKLNHNSLYINQRIELFLILTDGSYKDKTLFVPGTIRPGYYLKNKRMSGYKSYTRILSNGIKNLFRGMFSDGLDILSNPEVKPIGAFIVKSLKNL